jgi:hypothetical protein
LPPNFRIADELKNVPATDLLGSFLASYASSLGITGVETNTESIQTSKGTTTNNSGTSSSSFPAGGIAGASRLY